MRFINLIFLLTFSLSSMAFMSGIDPSRDTQANSSVELKPGGAHLMLIGPRRDVQAGEQILMIAQDSLERRFMLKFTVIDMRQETSHNDHNHHNHNH